MLARIRTIPLSDNIFYGHGLSGLLQEAVVQNGGAIYAYAVKEPQRYGVAVHHLNDCATGKTVTFTADC
jgi:glucose-1-phosphate thymidylyltransferase